MDAIVEQLKNYCDCVPMDDDDFMLKNLRELIAIISNLTCWGGSDCSTFLNEERKEIIKPIAPDKCKCHGTIMEFNPFYRPFYPDTLVMTLVEIDGINEVRTEIPAENWNYIESLDLIRIDLAGVLEISKCDCCPSEYWIEVLYSAGYELLPECLLQLFCDLLHVMYYKNSCDCKKCQACTDFTNDLTDEGYVDFTEDDEVSPKLNTYWYNIIIDGYKKNLSKISLCGTHCDRFVGVVV